MLRFIGLSLLGEGILPILFAVLVAVLLVLSLATWAIARYLKPRLGRKGYLVASLPFVLTAIAFYGELLRERPNSGPPSVLPAAKLSRLIQNLPAEGHLSITGLSYFDGELYVGTNLGIVEVHDDSISKLLRFQDWDSVVSGPWADAAHHLLWAMDEHTGEFLRFDGKKWTRMPKPVPVKGYYSRGDVLEGVRPIGNSLGFWLASAGSAWRWDASSLEWQTVTVHLPTPTDFGTVNEIVGVLPIAQTPLLIIRHQPLPYLVQPGEGFASDEIANTTDSSKVIERKSVPFLADTWAVAQDADYICTKTHTLVEVTSELVTGLPAPGECEAITSDTNMDLLISIKRKGIFRYSRKNGWTLIANSPYPSGGGDYWAFLGATNDRLAFALDAKPVVDPQHSNGNHMRFIQNAPTAIWTLRGGNFVLIPLR